MSNKRIILVITNIPAPYRVDGLNYVYSLLNKDKYELIVLFSRPLYHKRNFWNTGIEKAKFSFHYLDRFNSIDIKKIKLFDLGFTIKSELKKIKPDVVVASGFSILSFLAVRYCKKSDIPYLIGTGATMHRNQNDKFSFLKTPVRKYIIKNAKGFFVYGKSAIEYLRNFNVKDDRIFYTINTVDTIKFLEIGKARKYENKSELTLLYVGNVNKSKGIIYLLDAYKYLTKISDIKTNLLIVGGGDKLDYFKKYAEDNDLHNVTFTGAVKNTDVYKYYEKSDIFIFPTLDDVFGLVLVEAAASGLPIISSIFAGGSADVVKENYNGLIVNPINTIDFAEKIKKVIESFALRQKMSLNSIEIIEKEVNLNNYAKEFIRGIETQFKS
jgi:glycosyltransferase involved in cell wall biosynthesis